MLLIITGCIKVNDNTPYVAVRDDRLRLDDYISTIKWAIESEVFDKIVFCDNSGYVYDDKEIQDLAKIRFKKFEWLCFQASPDLVNTYGKGYGEGEIIKYVLNNSKIISDSDYFFCKITGRLKVLNIVLIFALVREHNDLYIYAIIIHGITLIGNFSLWPQVIKYIKPKSFKNMNIIQHWKKSMIYFIPTVATMVYTVLDKSMIGWITGSEFQNGYYEQAYKIEQILLVFVTTVGTVTFPRMAYFFENDNKEERKRIMGITMKFIMLIACPICFGTMAISENLIPVFLGKGYEECILLLRIFSFLIIIIGLDNTIGKQCLISAGKQKEYNIGVIGGAIVNFVTNILLIPKLGACGAAIASVFAESVILVAFIIYSKVELKIPKLSMCFFKYFISAMCMSIMVWRIGILISNKMVALSVQIFVGIILYGLFLLLMKDEFVMESIRRVKLKI